MRRGFYLPVPIAVTWCWFWGVNIMPYYSCAEVVYSHWIIRLGSNVRKSFYILFRREKSLLLQKLKEEWVSCFDIGYCTLFANWSMSHLLSLPICLPLGMLEVPLEMSLYVSWCGFFCFAHWAVSVFRGAFLFYRSGRILKKQFINKLCSRSSHTEPV